MPSVSIVASAARTTSGESAAVAVPLGRSGISCQVGISAISGAGATLAASIEWSSDGVTWFKSDPADTLTSITAVQNVAKHLTARGDFMRLAWVITGTTPSVTFAANLWFSGAQF